MTPGIPEKIQKLMDQYPDMNEAPLYSAKGLNVYIDLIKAKYATVVDIQKLLSYANMKMEEIKDPGHWFNQKQINAFMDYLIRQTGNSEIGREAGRFVCAPESLGMLRPYYRAFGSPKAAFEKLTQLAADVSLSSHYQSIIHGRNKIEITVTPYPGVKEEKFQCDNRKGYFESIFQLFDLPMPIIEHDKCMFDKNNKFDYCRYFVCWESMTSKRYKTIHNFLLLISLFVIIISPMIISFPSVIKFTCFLLLVNLGIGWYISNIENNELLPIIYNQSQIQSSAYQDLNEKIQETYQSFDMFRKISMGPSKRHRLEESLKAVINVLKERYDRCAILLANADQGKLIYQEGYGYTEEQLELWKKTGWFHILKESTGTFIETFRKNRSFLINDIEEVINDFSLRSAQFAKKMGVKSLISCPICYDDKPIGVLAVDNYKNNRELIQSDVNLLMGIAYQIGIHIQYHRMAAKEKQAAMVDMAQQAIHNIRNPSSAMNTNLKYLVNKCDLDEKVEKKIKAIQRQNKRIFELSEDFLRYTKPIEQRKEKLSIQQLLHEIECHLDDKKVHITSPSSDVSIEVDKNDIKWIFEELLENTRKYGDFPVEIQVKFQNQLLEIIYRDNGNGVPDNFVDEMFEPFISKDKQGSGLGLSTIRKKIEQHGGNISLKDTIKSGICFSIQVPICKE